MIYYIADWHYNHKNIIDIDDRPFADVHNMNRTLVQNWQDTVTKSDLVYILGDMFWGSETRAIPVLDQLPGEKVLIKGNHDAAKDPAFRARFLDIQDYMEIQDGDRHVVLCHYPMPCFKNHYYGWYHLYGHVHSGFEANIIRHESEVITALYDKPHNMFNAGAMMPWMGYTPRTLDHIITHQK